MYWEPSPRDTITERVEEFDECTYYAGSNPPRGGPKEDTNEVGVWPAERTICTGAGHQLRRGGPSRLLPQRGMRVGTYRCGATSLAVLCHAVLCCAVRGFVPELADQRPR